MLTVSDIIDRFGGPASLARESNVPLTTILGWRDANFVPSWRRPALVTVAKTLGIELSAAEFPTVDARKARKSRAATGQAA